MKSTKKKKIKTDLYSINSKFNIYLKRIMITKASINFPILQIWIGINSIDLDIALGARHIHRWLSLIIQKILNMNFTYFFIEITKHAKQSVSALKDWWNPSETIKYF